MARIFLSALFAFFVVFAGTTDPGLALDKIRVAHSSLSGAQAILWVAQDAGFFKKNGLDVTILFISGGPTVIKAMLAGDVPFGIIAGPAAIMAKLAGADTAVIASFVKTMEHAIFALPGINRPADLKGKKFAVNRYGSADDFGGRFALKKWGLEPDRDVAMLQLGGQPARYSALQAKAVDATLLQPPLTVTARKSGYVELASLADLGLDYLGACLVTTRSYSRSQPDIVRRFVKAVVEGIHFYKRNKQASIQSIAKFMRSNDSAALEETYDQYALKLLDPAPYPTIKGVQTILEDMAKGNPKVKGVDARSFIEPQFIKELEESGYIGKLYGDKR
jgi:NitT/TauT family transport system substrate-binding protein